MQCKNKRCQKEISDDFKYCPFCGKNQADKKHNTKSRGNGMGTVYQLPNNKWRAEITLEYTADKESGKLKRKTKTKSGFKSKSEALKYLPLLAGTPNNKKKYTFKQLYEKWRPEHEIKVTKATMDCYKSAFNHYDDIQYMDFKNIRTAHLQECVNRCKKGTRTKENMKALGTLLYKFAMREDIVEKNYAEYIFIQRKKAEPRQPFTHDEVEKINKAVGKVEYADFVLVLIYTGFRIDEFLSLKLEDYDPAEKALIGGSKTEAGRNRIITLSPKIINIIEERYKKGSPYLFDNNGKKFHKDTFRKKIYYPALEKIGVRRLPPHSCRHTFATLMKNIEVAELDKRRLLGHSSDEMKEHYTHTDYSDLRKITDLL